MTAAQLHDLEEHDLLDLGGYIDSMREQMAEHSTKLAWTGRRHQISRPVRIPGGIGIQTIWLFTEGLN